MARLLETDPYVAAGDSDTHNAGDTAVKFDLAYIVSEQDNWCQTTEAARMKSREPVIDHSIDYADTTQEDQIQHAADGLVNQQQFVQFAAQYQKCEGTCSAAEHHSICWQCWHRINSRDQRADQAITKIHSIDQREVDPTDQSCTTPIRMEPDI